MKNKSLSVLIFLIGILSVLPSFVEAATIRFSPYSNTYEVGNTFLVDIIISSPTESLNAASGVATFPKDKLEVVSISKSGSIFNFWVVEPSFSNTTGSINFEGVVLNPGFIGQSGKILTVTFRVKSSGLAKVSFQSGSILANDGQGTNILNGLGTAEFNLKQTGNNFISVPTVLAEEHINGAAEFVEPPLITGYPTELRRGQTLTITGPTYKNSKVTVWFKFGNETTNQTVTSNDSGEFVYIGERDFNQGVYKFWTTVEHYSGVQSGPSDNLTILIKPSLIEQCGIWIMKALAIFAPIAILVLLLAFILLFGWYKFKIWKKRLRKEVQDVEEGVHKAFDLLQESARSGKMKTDLSGAEEYIDREIKVVEKELK